MDEKILVKSFKRNFDTKKWIVIWGGFTLVYFIKNIIEGSFLAAAITLALFSVIGVIAFIPFYLVNSNEMTVTDKRIYGKVLFGKRVDLPIDSVSAVSTSRMFKGVSVSTSSGRITFHGMKNADEIYSAINRLLIERQDLARVASKPEIIVESQTDEVDKLMKYKNLLEQGVITQEEFDAKKKQILGL